LLNLLLLRCSCSPFVWQQTKVWHNMLVSFNHLRLSGALFLPLLHFFLYFFRPLCPSLQEVCVTVCTT
jgi:hypothetical protein